MPRLPITLPLDGVSFESAVLSLKNDNGFAAIDSRNAGRGSRFSIVASRPLHTLSFSGAFVTIDGHTVIDSPISALSKFFDRISGWKADKYLPFSGGMIGYIGFEGARALSGLSPAKGFSRLPQCRMGIYETAAIFDSVENLAFIVANAAAENEANQNADELAERLFLNKDCAAGGPSASNCAARARRLTPDNLNFEKILKEASLWLRAGKLENIHIARRATAPSSGGDPVATFLAGCKKGMIQAIFSHEDAYAIAVSPSLKPDIDDSALYPSGISRARRLAALMPSKTHAGSPVEAAISFLDANEEIYRNLYGGFFGTLDSGRFTFRTISETKEFSDGTMASTLGVDIGSDTSSNVPLNFSEGVFGSL